MTAGGLTAPIALAEALGVARGVANTDALLDGEWRALVQEGNRVIAALSARGFHLVGASPPRAVVGREGH